MHTLLLNRDRLNEILSGRPDRSSGVMIDGEEFYPSGIDTDIEEMREFFTDIFYEEALASAHDLENGKSGDRLREDYIRKFIDEVYAEKDGMLFRKASAPEWYLPEMRIYPATSISKDERTGSFTAWIIVNGEHQPITVKHHIYKGKAAALYFASGLPVKVLEQSD